MNTRYARAESVISSADPEGRGVLLSVEEGIYYTLNPSGWRVWTELEAPRSVPELVGPFAHAHGIPEDQATQDLTALFDDLEERGLVSRVEE